MTSAAPIVTAGQLLASSKLGRQKTMTWQVDQWRYGNEPSGSEALQLCGKLSVVLQYRS